MYYIVLFHYEGIRIFLKEPDPGPRIAHIDEIVQFNCSVMDGYRYRLEWGLLFPWNTIEVSTDDYDVLDSLKRRGITVRKPRNTTSFLTITASTSINNTVIMCIAVEHHPIRRHNSERVQLIIGMKLL